MRLSLCHIQSMKSLIDIYRYSDFRSFLKDRYEEWKAHDDKVSLRYLAKRVGLSSNSHLKMVMDGQHNLSPSLAKKLAKLFGLSKRETSFFLALVQYTQANDTEEKTEALEELRRNRPFVKLNQLAFDQFDYYNDRLTLALRELVSVEGFREDPLWIAEKLAFKATPEEIREAIEKLLRLNLLTRNAEGSLMATHAHITSGDGFGPVALKGYYKNGFSAAIESLELPGDIRHLGGMSMSVSGKTYERIVEHFQTFMEAVRSEVDHDDAPEDVYRLVFGLFPLTDVSSKKE